MLTTRLNTILLVDDDPDCNFLHRRLLRKSACSERVVVTQDADDAIAFITEAAEEEPGRLPELVLLDINMPGMNGWEFLDEFEKLPESIRSNIKVIILTSSLNPDDKNRADANPSVAGMYDKLLTREIIREILKDHFGERF